MGKGMALSSPEAGAGGSDGQGSLLGGGGSGVSSHKVSGVRSLYQPHLLVRDVLGSRVNSPLEVQEPLLKVNVSPRSQDWEPKRDSSYPGLGLPVKPIMALRC